MAKIFQRKEPVRIVHSSWLPSSRTGCRNSSSLAHPTLGSTPLCSPWRPCLGLWFLGSLFNGLDECGLHIAHSVDLYDVICYTDVNFLQLFFWERFASLAPVPLEFDPAPLKKVQGVNKVQTNLLKVQGTRCFGVRRLEESRRSLLEVIHVEANFNFQPYSHTLVGVLPNLMFPS